MYTRPTPFNSTALAFAAIVTLAMLGLVDGLATQGSEEALLAAQKAAPVAAASASPRG